jgi:hypothetical protein
MIGQVSSLRFGNFHRSLTPYATNSSSSQDSSLRRLDGPYNLSMKLTSKGLEFSRSSYTDNWATRRRQSSYSAEMHSSPTPTRDRGSQDSCKDVIAEHIFDGQRITFRELMDRVHRLARRLQKLGVEPDSIAGPR